MPQGPNPRSASIGSERWPAQALVERTYRFGSGATLIPLVDFSHVRDVMEAFREGADPDAHVDGQAVALNNLQIGAELEIPVGTARGDMWFGPGPCHVASDESDGARALDEDSRIGPRTRGRIEFGFDCMLDYDLVLGFERFHSRLGRREFQSCGSGIDLRLEFQRFAAPAGQEINAFRIPRCA